MKTEMKCLNFSQQKLNAETTLWACLGHRRMKALTGKMGAENLGRRVSLGELVRTRLNTQVPAECSCLQVQAQGVPSCNQKPCSEVDSSSSLQALTSYHAVTHLVIFTPREKSAIKKTTVSHELFTIRLPFISL